MKKMLFVCMVLSGSVVIASHNQTQQKQANLERLLMFKQAVVFCCICINSCKDITSHRFLTDAQSHVSIQATDDNKQLPQSSSCVQHSCSIINLCYPESGCCTRRNGLSRSTSLNELKKINNE